MSANTLNNENFFKQPEAEPINSKEATGFIIDKAKQLVSQLLEGRANDKPPFLPKEYLRFVNIKEIQKTDLGDTSGLLLKFHDGYVIRVNQDHSQVRQNFSCAHEIGHILFSDLKLENYVRNIEYRKFNTSKTMEIQSKARETLCDAVAAELLMPELIFRKYLSIFGLSITSLDHLAYTFQVSVQAAARRITEISVEPCIVTRWYPWPKSKPKVLRPIMGRPSNKKVKYTLVNKSVSLSSPIYKAYQNDRVAKTTKFFNDGSTTKRFPVEAKGFGRGDTRFVISFAFPDRQKP